MISLASCALLILATLLGGCLGDTSTSEQSPAEPAEREFTRGDRLTLSGVLIDSRCHATDPSHIGNDHTIDGQLVTACATACAKQGFPAALLTDDQGLPVWMLATNAQVLADYMAGTVRVAGTVRARGVLIPERVELQVDNEWIIIM